VAVLFSGASGTGKTMAACVLAGASGRPLYRVDLAGVVSKYIGETEKNLDRVFTAARGADAVLLFDEADALLGKRSEVKDAHDRYANLEVAYLLQRLEEHDGVVILASNLPRNIDAAFARRLHYVVEFPRPGPELREQIWRGILAPPVPTAGDLDLASVAAAYELTGGEIQNLVLEAAFAAAARGEPIGQSALLRVLQRQQTRQGRSTRWGARVEPVASGGVE
jgi:SpoVK/Ycf46/Vps4 family AAA+-type ATPase